MGLFIRILLFLLLPVQAAATVWTVETLPDPKSSASKRFVTDPDNVIPDETEAAINEICWDIEQHSTVQFAIAVMHSVGSEVPKTFAGNLFNYWKIGNAQKSNGLLLVIVLDQKRWEFETGYGLEADLTDYECRRLGESSLVPFFRTGNFAGGILATTLAVRSALFAKYDIGVTTDSTAVPEDYADAFQAAGSYTYVPPPFDYREHYRNNWGDCIWYFGFMILPYWVVMLFWGLSTYRKKDSKKKTSAKKRTQPARKPSFVLFMLFALMPGVITLAWFIEPFIHSDYLEIMILGTMYFSLFLLIADYRVRLNKTVLRGSGDIYTRYSDLRETHSGWTFWAPFFFPLFFIPYLFWYYGKCRNLRRQSRPCRKCQVTMHYAENVINEVEDDQYLSRGQVKEEHLKSRDWDVWLCKSCSNAEVLGYKAFFTRFDKCPQCGFLAEKYLGSETVVAATYDSSGTGKRKYSCENCGNYRETTYTIPRKTRSESSSSGGGGYSGGGGGSSWGGGSSGGGGAGGSW